MSEEKPQGPASQILLHIGVIWEFKKHTGWDFPGGVVVKNPPANTTVWALVREDPTCHGANKPVHHNYLAWALEPASHNYWAHTPQLLKPACLEPVLCNKRSHYNEKPTHHNKEYPRLPQPEKACTQQWRPNAAKKTKNKKPCWLPAPQILI